MTVELYKQHKTTFAESWCPISNAALHGENLPLSFKRAIIKVLPKSGKVVDATSLRPIRLINSDQKVLAHVLAQRFQPVLAEMLGFEQYAYLTDRNISSALIDLKCRCKTSDSDTCLVKLDFSKAFDRVDRPDMFQLFRKLRIPEKLITLIQTMYKKTKSSNGINGYFAKNITLHRGVRQGCPLSALLFIVALEPLLNKLSFDSKLSRASVRSAVAYADDVTVVVDRNKLERLFEILDWFSKGTQFKMNRDKCEIVADFENAQSEHKN